MNRFVSADLVKGDDLHSKIAETLLLTMEKYNIQHAVLTLLYMERHKLITKESMKAEYKGRPRCCIGHYDGSVHDDTDAFATQMLTKVELTSVDHADFVATFFLPKLSNEELKLVKDRNEDHLKTYFYHCEGFDPDVPKDEMAKSKSKSKYVACECMRFTIELNLDEVYAEHQD